ncbi:MAG: hypothetical protein KAI79_14205 [Bacteroidales bacterium]|nr:hypothetical protein [Bacteroidales bacterium]
MRINISEANALIELVGSDGWSVADGVISYYDNIPRIPSLVEISDKMIELNIQEDNRISNEPYYKILRETDWYVIRLNETGKEIPEDIVILRQESRDSIIN